MSLNIIHLASQQNYPNFELYRVKETGGLAFDYVNVTAFFHSRGFYIHRVSAIKHVYIRIVENIVKEVGIIDFKREILDFIHKNESRYVHEFFIKNIDKVTGDKFLETLESKTINFRKDKKDSIELYFQNCIVKVTSHSIECYSYKDLIGYIWESQIIQRDFEYTEGSTGDFKKFCWNISAENADRYSSICSTIGFLIHNYKNPAYCPAVILNDEVISDNPEGGTGKGLLIKAVQQYLRTVTLEGKTFSFEKNFLYQRVNADTRILSFQDVNKTFDFERLFSVLTDGIEVDKKGIGSVMIDFEDSPKVVITTNYALRGEGNSHERRRHEIEISQYYNSTHTPFDDFKRMMFIDWDKSEWQRFDSFIVECCRYFLKNGLIKQKLINLEEKRLLSATCKDFIDFMHGFSFQVVSKSEIYDNFLREFPEYHKQKWFSKQTMSKWVSAYARYHNYSVEDYVYQSIRHYKFEKLQS